MSEARSVVWLTVSKALEKSRDTVTVRCGGATKSQDCAPAKGRYMNVATSI